MNKYVESERQSSEVVKPYFVNGLQLMHGDTLVLVMNFNSGEVQIVNDCYVPVSLRGGLKDFPKVAYGNSRSGIMKYNMDVRIISDKNKLCFMRWLSNRITMLDTWSVQSAYNIFCNNTTNDNIAKAKTVISCRGISNYDKYWLKLSGETLTFDEVRKYNNCRACL